MYTLRAIINRLDLDFSMLLVNLADHMKVDRIRSVQRRVRCPVGLMLLALRGQYFLGSFGLMCISLCF